MDAGELALGFRYVWPLWLHNHLLLPLHTYKMSEVEVPRGLTGGIDGLQ
jgi:hypothetical protein